MVSTSSSVCHSPTPNQPKLINISDAVTKSSKIIRLVSNEDEDKEEVTVHKELLCFFSPYYAAALNGNFLEAQKDQFEVDLDGEDLQNFAAWIYTGELSKERLENTNLYVFADQVDILALRRDALSQLSKLEYDMLAYQCVKHILNNVTQQSQIYKWMLDSYIAHWASITDDEDECILDNESDPDHLLANFIYQVMKGITVRDTDDSTDCSRCSCCNDICQYHEHPSKEEWEASMLKLYTCSNSAVY